MHTQMDRQVGSTHERMDWCIQNLDGYHRKSFKNFHPISSAIGLEETMLESCAYRDFNKYPTGIVNPAFSGMLLCKLNPDHLVNEFPINKYHEKKNGIIIHHTKVYVFTSIRNDDIDSYLKILLRKKKMKHNINPTIAAIMLRKYV